MDGPDASAPEDRSAVDSPPQGMLETAQNAQPIPAGPRVAAGASFRGKRTRMSRRQQFSLLIVRGDGTRLVRFNFARPLAVGVAASIAVVAAVVGLLLGNWLHLRELTREAVNFEQRIAEQEETIETFNRRAAELRKEITGWRELHARIWEPFGPEMGPKAVKGGKPAVGSESMIFERCDISPVARPFHQGLLQLSASSVGRCR